MYMKTCVMGSRNLYRANQYKQIKSLLSAEVSTQRVLHLSVHLSRCMQSDASMQSCFLFSQTAINLICCSPLISSRCHTSKFWACEHHTISAGECEGGVEQERWGGVGMEVGRGRKEVEWGEGEVGCGREGGGVEVDREKGGGQGQGAESRTGRLTILAVLDGVALQAWAKLSWLRTRVSSAVKASTSCVKSLTSCISEKKNMPHCKGRGRQACCYL